MDLQLKDKRAVVTGSTAGIGFAIARALASEGASVVVNGQTRGRVTSAVNEIRRHTPHANVRGIAADLSTLAGIATLRSDTPEAEILVTNLGVFEAKSFASITDAVWQRYAGE